MPKCCSFHNNNRWRALYENWYENWDGSAREDTQFSNILKWIYWNIFMFKHAFRCVCVLWVSAIPCVYVMLISFDTVCVDARRKCVFIIKLNTSNGKHWNAHENVLKRVHVCQIVENGMHTQGKALKKRWNNKCTGISIDDVDLTVFSMGHHLSLASGVRVLTARSSFSWHHFVYHLWCRHSSLCLNQFSFNERKTFPSSAEQCNHSENKSYTRKYADDKNNRRFAYDFARARARTHTQNQLYKDNELNAFCIWHSRW